MLCCPAIQMIESLYPKSAKPWTSNICQYGLINKEACTIFEIGEKFEIIHPFKKIIIYLISFSLADGIDNAAVFCCFLTPQYQQYVECQIELKYATQKSVKIIPCILKDPKIWKCAEWLESMHSRS